MERLVRVFAFAFVIYTNLQLQVLADTPANCTYEDIRGAWTFSVGDGGHDNKLDCSKFRSGTHEITIELLYPDTAIDQFGNIGFWTVVYNQGFEVVVHGRKYFAFSKYEGTPTNATSYCDKIMPGWSHDVLGHDWACYVGKKTSGASRRVPISKSSKPTSENEIEMTYRHNPSFVSKINSVQNAWVGGHYPEFEKFTLSEMQARAGGSKGMFTRTKPAPATEQDKKFSQYLPREFDWRDADGVNYVSPVRNQGSCGSCYAFSSMGMCEARLRIATNNTEQVVFSPQDIVDCSGYSQGCDGGFPYLIGGKYAEDFGLVDESCAPYQGKGLSGCQTKQSCSRHYFTKYRYVGGYYGACNEERMMLSLYENGPLSVSFMVYNDFMSYKGGIYKHTGLEDQFNPFEITNHAVLLVGWGVDETSGTKFWIVKNSWGGSWGEKGFFRIVRGVDEVAIESIAVETFPIF